MATKKGNKWAVNYKNEVGKVQTAYFLTKEEAELWQAQRKFDKKHAPNAILPPKTGDLVFAELALEYFKHKKWANSTKKSELPLFNKRIMPLLGGVPVKTLTVRDLDRVAAHLRGLGWQNSTINRRMKTIRAILSFGESRGYLDRAPKWQKLPDDTKVVREPSPEEIQALYKNASPHMQRIILIATATGIRVGPSELFKLKWEHVDFQQKSIFIESAKKFGVARRTIPMTEELETRLRQWYEQDGGKGYVIHWAGKPINEIRYSWATAKKKAGIIRPLNPYSMRHYFATHALQNGTDVGTVASILGHSSPVMLLTTYQHVLSDAKRQAVKNVPLPTILPTDAPK